MYSYKLGFIKKNIAMFSIFLFKTIEEIMYYFVEKVLFPELPNSDEGLQIRAIKKIFNHVCYCKHDII